MRQRLFLCYFIAFSTLFSSSLVAKEITPLSGVAGRQGLLPNTAPTARQLKNHKNSLAQRLNEAQKNKLQDFWFSSFLGPNWNPANIDTSRPASFQTDFYSLRTQGSNSIRWALRSTNHIDYPFLRIPKKCNDAVTRMTTTVQTYILRWEQGIAITERENHIKEDLEEEVKRIKARLDELYRSDLAKDCFEPAAMAYILKSLGALGSQKVNSFQTESYRLLLAFLYNHGYLEILTPGKRCNAGGLWNRKKEPENETLDSDFIMYGAYICQNSVISIDPFQAPFDLAASLLHELDHLFRDKYSELYQSGNSEDDSLKKSFFDLGLDEYLASTVGATFQIVKTLQNQPLWKLAEGDSIQSILPNNDLTKFDPNFGEGQITALGLFKAFWGEGGLLSETSARLSSLSDSYFLAFLSSDPKKSLKSKGISVTSDFSNKISHMRENIFHKIADAYQLDSTELLNHSKEALNKNGLKNSPLLLWNKYVIANLAGEENYQLDSASPHQLWVQYAFWDLFRRLQAEKTASCNGFEKLMAAKSGDIQSYLGATRHYSRDDTQEHLCRNATYYDKTDSPACDSPGYSCPYRQPFLLHVDSKLEGASVRPEGSSVRPEGSSVRPEGSGVRPEGASVRPEGSGVRPEGSSVRPEGSAVRPEIAVKP